MRRSKNGALLCKRFGFRRSFRVRLARLCGKRFRDPEIEKLGSARSEHDVSGLEVPVDHTMAVRIVHGVGYLDPETNRFLER